MDNDEMEKRIAQSMERLEACEITIPELTCFTQLVNKEQEKIRKRQNSQFAIFIAVSFFIVAAVILCLFANIAVFAALQAVSLTIFLCVFLRLQVKGVMS